MKYIDADRLREKIAEQMDSLHREVGRSAGTITSKGYGMMEAFQIMRSIIDSLQQEQPEVFDTVAFQKGVAEGRRLEREEMPKWRNYGPNIIKDPFVTDLGSLVVGEKCIRIYELYNLPGFKND